MNLSTIQSYIRNDRVPRATISTPHKPNSLVGRKPAITNDLTRLSVWSAIMNADVISTPRAARVRRSARGALIAPATCRPPGPAGTEVGHGAARTPRGASGRGTGRSGAGAASPRGAPTGAPA